MSEKTTVDRGSEPVPVPDEIGGRLPTEPSVEERRGVPGSLLERGRQRSEELEKQTTEIFLVPRYDDVLAVELRAISWAKTEEFITKNQRVPNAVQNTAGDEIIAATMGFFEVKGDEEIVLERLEDSPTWETLARAFGKKLPDPCHPRVALVALCTDQGVIALNAMYRRWLAGENTGISQVARQIRRDF